MPVEDRDPRPRQSRLLRRGQPDARGDNQGLGIDVGVQEAVEEHEAVGACRVQPIAISPVELKYGLSFTATGNDTADFTWRTISTCRSSTVRPEVWGSPGTK